MSNNRELGASLSEEKLLTVGNTSDVQAIVQEYETETKSKFIVYYNDKSFGSNGKFTLITQQYFKCRGRDLGANQSTTLF